MRLPAAITVAAALTVVAVASHAADELYAYPQKGQSEEQLEKDKEECHDWAVKQTGTDPVKMANEAAPSGKEGGGGGAAAGAGLGAVHGALGGDAGAGAARGVGMAGLIRVIRARRQMNQQHEAYMQSHEEREAQLGNYDRAYSACLEARGYTVR